MNTGQMMLVIAGFILLSRVATSVSETILASDRQALAARRAAEAVMLGEGRLDDVAFGPFDSLATGSRVDTVATPLGALRCSTHVAYVEAAAPDVAVAGPSTFKRVAVTVTGEGFDAVEVRAVAGSY